MRAYADESELLLYVGGFFERVLTSPELGSRLAGTGVVLHHVCHDRWWVAPSRGCCARARTRRSCASTTATCCARTAGRTC